MSASLTGSDPARTRPLARPATHPRFLASTYSASLAGSPAMSLGLPWLRPCTKSSVVPMNPSSGECFVDEFSGGRLELETAEMGDQAGNPEAGVRHPVPQVLRRRLGDRSSVDVDRDAGSVLRLHTRVVQRHQLPPVVEHRGPGRSRCGVGLVDHAARILDGEKPVVAEGHLTAVAAGVLNDVDRMADHHLADRAHQRYPPEA